MQSCTFRKPGSWRGKGRKGGEKAFPAGEWPESGLPNASVSRGPAELQSSGCATPGLPQAAGPALCPRQHPSFRGCVHTVTATQGKSPSRHLSSARGPWGAQDTWRVSQLLELKLRGGSSTLFTGPRVGFHCDEQRPLGGASQWSTDTSRSKLRKLGFRLSPDRTAAQGCRGKSLAIPMLRPHTRQSVPSGPQVHGLSV